MSLLRNLMAANLTSPPSTYRATILADGPVAYWRLGETTGTSAADSSGNGHNATYQGTFSLAQPSLLPHGDGASFYSAAAADVALPSGWISGVQSPLTIDAWIKCASFSNSPNILSTYNGGFSFGFTNTGKLEVSNPGVVLLAQDGAILSANTVYHVAVTWNAAGQVIFYVNGVASSSFSGLAAASTGKDPAFIAAYLASNSRMNGYMQEVAIYNKVLTAAQIASHYSAA